MAQKRLTLEDLNSGGTNYAAMSPVKKHYKWVGNELVESDGKPEKAKYPKVTTRDHNLYVQFADGEEEVTKNFYSLAFKSSYDFDITRLNTRGDITVEVYIDGELYQEYLFDFKNGTSTLTAQYEVSAQKKADESKVSSDTSSRTSSTAASSAVVSSEKEVSFAPAASEQTVTSSDVQSEKTEMFPQVVSGEIE